MQAAAQAKGNYAKLRQRHITGTLLEGRGLGRDRLLSRSAPRAVGVIHR